MIYGLASIYSVISSSNKTCSSFSSSVSLCPSSYPLLTASSHKAQSHGLLVTWAISRFMKEGLGVG